jgi:hypothetical protein
MRRPLRVVAPLFHLASPASAQLFSSRVQGPSLQYAALSVTCENSDSDDLGLSTCSQQVTGPVSQSGCSSSQAESSRRYRNTPWISGLTSSTQRKMTWGGAEAPGNGSDPLASEIAGRVGPATEEAFACGITTVPLAFPSFTQLSPAERKAPPYSMWLCCYPAKIQTTMTWC